MSRVKVADVQYYATNQDEHGYFPVFLNRVKRWDDGSVERYEQAPTAICGSFKEAITLCGEWNQRIVNGDSEAEARIRELGVQS